MLQYCSFSTGVHLTFSLKLCFSLLHCPHQCPEQFCWWLCGSEVQGSWKETGNHKLSSNKAASLLLFTFQLPKAQLWGVKQDSECVFASGNGAFFLFLFFPSCLLLGEWLLSEHAQFTSVPGEMNSTAIKPLFHVFQTHVRILFSLGRLEK